MSVAYMSIRPRAWVTSEPRGKVSVTNCTPNSEPVQAAGAKAVCQVLQSGSGFTVDFNNGAPVSREGNKRIMQLLKESLQIYSVVARY